MRRPDRRGLFARGLAATLVFSAAFAIRVRGISTHFWLLEDQIRDWGIALRPLTELPLVGPPTHVGGYTIGPAYYWLMWLIRVTVGPWFDNLPHGGGIGQAIVESAADAVLLLAIWHRTRSPWFALAAAMLIATAAYDVSLSAIVWTTVVASALGKLAVASVLFGWHRAGGWRVAAIAALAWSAVHVYTGAVFMTVGVFAALLADPLARRAWGELRRNAAAIALVVMALQVPYAIHQVQHRFEAPAMGAVTDGVSRIIAGKAAPEVAKSVSGYVAAFHFIQVEPWSVPAAPWILLALTAAAAVRYRGDPAVIVLLLLPQAAAIAGYALFLDALEHYYYIPIVPIAVVAMCLGTAVPSASRAGRWLGVTVAMAAAAIVPARLQFASTLHRMPEYEVLVQGARTIAGDGRPVGAIQADFPLHPTTRPSFLYEILGGSVDPRAPWIAVIARDGGVEWRQADDQLRSP